nr:MAG TPA: Major head protein [Caudoviricetes sp.]
MDGQTTTTQGAEQTTQVEQTSTAATQEQQTVEATPEKLNAFQKFMEGLFGGNKNTEDKAEDKPSGDTTADQDNAETDKTFTQADIDAAVEAAQQKWKDEVAEAERIKNLSPEEKAAEEEKKKDTEIETLRAQLLQKELKESAVKALEKEGFPVGLAEMINYSSKEEMENSLKKTQEIFKESLSAAVTERLKGKTPEGLGNATSAENLLRDQIAKNVRGL